MCCGNFASIFQLTKFLFPSGITDTSDILASPNTINTTDETTFRRGSHSFINLNFRRRTETGAPAYDEFDPVAIPAARSPNVTHRRLLSKLKSTGPKHTCKLPPSPYTQHARPFVFLAADGHLCSWQLCDCFSSSPRHRRVDRRRTAAAGRGCRARASRATTKKQRSCSHCR